MPDDLPQHGRRRGTPRAMRRVTVGQSQDWRFPKTAYQAVEDRPGTLVCPRCRAISLQKRWFLDDALYDKLRRDPEAQLVRCPGCERVERGIYEGRVVLRGDWIVDHKDEVINLIKNQESEARQTNPFSRIGVIKDQGNQLELYVTTQWLAVRIGKELRKAHKGELQIDHLPQQKFSLVTWHRPSPLTREAGA